MRLVSTAGNPIPEGAIVGKLGTPDGVFLRYARWASTNQKRGTVLLLQGRAEFIEKYFEVVRELRERGFAVVTFDWRGQGLSQRLLPEKQKGHVNTFHDYDVDLETVIHQVLRPISTPPLIGLAHSTGAAILVRSAAREHLLFDRMVMTSPMIGLPYIGSSSGLLRAALRAMCALGLGQHYIPGGSSAHMDMRPFSGNRRTSDPERYARNAQVVAAEPSLGIGSPTISWTKAAMEAVYEFSSSEYAVAIRNPTLIVAAGGDDIVSTVASRTFARRSNSISYIVIAAAKHELLMERNAFRTQVWSAFDSFLM
jgi:lysophospholipase